MKSDDLESLRSRIEVLEKESAHQCDVLEIKAVIARYSRALDWMNGAMLDTVFYNDAEIDYGFFRGNGKDFKAHLMELEHGLGRRWHLTSQVSLDIKETVAEGESYSVAIAAGPMITAENSDFMLFFGFYKDRFLKRNGRWGLIARKHLQLSGTRLADQIMPDQLGVLNYIGSASPEHPDYRLLADTRPLDDA